MTPTRARVCGNKQSHPGRLAALQNMLGLRKRGANLALMSVYRCKFCGSWHIGHRPGAGRRR